MKLKCLIIDDEPLAHKVLENYIAETGFLELAGNCFSGLEAIEFLSECPVDIIFLDISMPRMTGTSFLETVPNRPAVIMTTAFRDYAVESYDYNVTDFLLKPFSFERFLKAILKARNVHKPALAHPKKHSENTKPVYLKNGSEVIRIEPEDLVYAEGLKEYLKLHLKDKTIIYKGSFQQVEAAFPAGAFLRIHKSFLIGLNHLSAFRGNEVKVGERWLPVGRSYKMQVQNFLSGNLVN